MRETLKVARKMVKEPLYGQMEISISAAGEQTSSMVWESTTILRIRLRSKGSGSMERDMSGLHELITYK